ncbi:apoptosis-enhancing nuclease isoform X2 [Alosa pseudoharengus]|uniref:apoptosis-enhancing nuclease isoform X2 n=1 Tax=Alosa pseudoharengus TaxID=34774 RepID=UPI003F8CD6F1
MSGIEITCGRISPCGPLNGQPRAHTYSISKVYKKSKRKPTKRKTKEKPDDGTDAHKATSSAKKRKLCEIKGDDLGCSAYSGTGDCVVDTPASVFSKSTGDQESTIDHLQPIMEKRVPTFGERWELDSGFASEASPPSSGRCSPCIGRCPAKVVAIDCEMVGTGPDGHCSELARCSVLNYDGAVLYDQYILPSRPVTNYRTRWSGIRKQHLQHAVPFQKARTEVGKAGHCSVEDARAALDLYKLVEEQWEQDDSERERALAQPGPDPSLSHYMLDQYWPEHMDCVQ